jgi:hypothetical protein
VIDDNFDIVFRRQGFSNFTYQSETQSDPQVLSQRWVHPPDGAEYLADEFYRRFGGNSFRKLLGRIYKATAGVSRQYLAKFCSDPTLEQHLTFMRNQELIIEVDSMVSKAPRCQHIADIGRTFEWYVARWFQAFLHCPARYNVHVPGILEGGDLDVVAFLDGLRIWIECKSGRDITDTQLDLFVRRAQEFNPVLAILLIDTDENSVMDNYIARLNKPHPQEDLQFHLKNPREWLFFRGRGLYVVGVPNSIQESLLAVLRFYHDRVRFVPFVGDI